MSPKRSFAKKISLIRHSLATMGVSETLKALGRYALASSYEDRGFDKRYSIDTESHIRNEDLAMSDPIVQSHATCYCTLPEKFTRYLISHLDINYQEFDFVDVGCGKGRVLFVAARFPFRSIYGIELSQPAVEIAQKNVRTYQCADQHCFNIHIRNEDARHFEPDLTNTVYYFFQPFDTVTLDTVLTRISSRLRDQGRTIYVICLWYPIEAALKVFERFGFRTIEQNHTLHLDYAIIQLQ